MKKKYLVIIAPLIIISGLRAQGVWEPTAPMVYNRASLWCIEFADPYDGWIGSTFDGTARTRDEGQSYQRAFAGVRIAPCIKFLDYEHGWIGYDQLFFTIDGGRTWGQGEYEGCDIQGFCFIDDSIGWAAGYTAMMGIPEDPPPDQFGSISHTRDGGRNWTVQWEEADPGLEEISDICFADEEHGIATYNSNSLLITDNGGEDWDVIRDCPIGFECLAHVEGETFVGGGNDPNGNNPAFPVIIRSTDLGRNWEVVWENEDHQNRLVREITILDDEIGYANPMGAWLLRTEDGGRNWDEFPGPPDQRIEHMSFPTDWRGYVTIGSRDGDQVWRWTDTDRTVRLVMEEGWNMASINVDPLERAVDDVMRPLLRSETLIQMKDFAGHFLRPDQDFNNIPAPWSMEQGYMVKVERDIYLSIEGERIPPDTPIELVEGWQMVAYYPRQVVQARDALEGIRDILFLAKDDRGHFYIPEFGFGGMLPMREGEGYMLKMYEAARLVYQPDE